MIFSRLGNYIEVVDERNTDGKFTAKELKGISINKVLMSTKADTSNLNVKNYKVLKSNYFTYCTVTSRNGNKISLAYNDGKDCIISSINPVFRVVDERKLLPKYLMMYFKRPEFDRYARFNSWGSARETFSWEDFCDIELVIPPIEIQKKYVAVYESLLHNLKVYESKLDDLKLVCDGYIEKKRQEKDVFIGSNIIETNKKNVDKIADMEMGVSIGKEFILTKAKSSVIENQKLIESGTFAYNSNTSRNSDTISLALNDSDKAYAVSNTYIAFQCTDVLIPRYLNLWFKRKEFDRFARFNSWGSARETIGIDELKRAAIAIPTKDEQIAIVNIFNSLNRRKQYIDILKRQIYNICPILIKGSIEECR